MRLHVRARYVCRAVIYEPGQVLDLSDAEAAGLLADSPGSFFVEPPAAIDLAVVDASAEALAAVIEEPPATTAIRSARAKGA